jgi:DNA-binding transcriptional regulator YhcF (GntR family)
MFITIDPNNTQRAIYLQVADSIRLLIAKREFPKGSALPPVRQVAADLGVSLNTISLAYRELEKEGLVKVRHGSGAIVTRSARQEMSHEIETGENNLRGLLRCVLARFAVSGLSGAEVRRIVKDELNQILNAR